MSKINQYFIARKSLTLWLMWLFFALSLGYALIVMFLIPSWNFWLMIIPGVIAYYFRFLYSKAAYDPQKDKLSPEYVPYKQRKKKKKK